MIRKTKKMLVVEGKLGRSLEEVIPETFNRTGSMLDTARELGIPVQTLYTWVAKLRIDKRNELVAPKK